MADSAVESKVSKYVLKNAPYGEEKFVIEDLAKLLDNTSINDEDNQKVLRENYEEHLSIFRNSDNSQKVLVTKYNYQDGYYIDQKTNQKFTVDFNEQKVTGVEDLEEGPTGELKELRDVLDKQMDTYVKNYYRDDESVHLVHATGSDDDLTLYVLVTGKFLNFNNLYAGEWSSDWKVTKGSIEGSVRVNAHYFEDGNIQLKQSKQFQGTYEHSEDQETNATRIVGAIRVFENKVVTGFTNVYENTMEKAFKNMRKPIPVTKSKMDWNISVQKVVASLKR